jgi:DNA-binding transcriptional LysR family regulator
MLDLRGAEAFVAVAEARSFSAAARSLGVTPSALSQSVRALEERLGVTLLSRTTRSVRVTDAGHRLLDRLSPALRETAIALDEARDSGDVVRGTLRITGSRVTIPLFIEPILQPLLTTYPELSLDVDVEDRFVDIVAGGFDAGIRISESIQPDLVTVRLSPPFRFVVVGAPSYFAEHPRPRRPRDLLEHDCINFRQPTTGARYAWELERRGKDEKIAVSGRIVCNDGDLMRSAARKGLGLAYLPEPMVAREIARGELERVLDEYAPVEPGFFLYFPRRTGMQPKLRALIDVARRVLVGAQRAKR